MTRRSRATPACLTLLPAVVAAALGCSTSLPAVDGVNLGTSLLGASPTCNWYGSCVDLKTHWGRQDLSVYVSVRLKRDAGGGYRWSLPSDTDWLVKAWNAEGKPIPFLGLLDTRRRLDGTESVRIVPEVDISGLEDCLYLLIRPNVKTRAGMVVEMRPTVVVRELRGGKWTPFEAEIPLIPAEQSDMTPMPELVLPVYHE